MDFAEKFNEFKTFKQSLRNIYDVFIPDIDCWKIEDIAKVR